MSRLGEMAALTEQIIRSLAKAFSDGGVASEARMSELYAFAFFVVSHTVMLKQAHWHDLPTELQEFGDVMATAIRLQANPLAGPYDATKGIGDADIRQFLGLVDERIPEYETIFVQKMAQRQAPWLGLSGSLVNHTIDPRSREQPGPRLQVVLSLQIAADFVHAAKVLFPNETK